MDLYPSHSRAAAQHIQDPCLNGNSEQIGVDCSDREMYMRRARYTARRQGMYTALRTRFCRMSKVPLVRPRRMLIGLQACICARLPAGGGV